ncbi:MAG TPA: bifunctional diaminohydroxyphosphoribosylaminopyrimidine deaminase/5-amino-6-(5-phosphoribosylamino)uracil reductase RibD [Firmicutes bacterium]|nr:bifunctional diaminohydroxyphosphoribosylaminopyrimidine deaminase/5-amino-6-(5-phosphoribosylamino)uracil reductase RibD [Bacillota bacterium]
MRKQDEKWMRLALELAAKGKGKTSPNPLVGAVVVKDGALIGSGFHPKAGEPHAEVFALHEAGAEAQGATLYVTLEPCAHFGRTPPCTNQVINAGIRRVAVAMIDPNPRVSGRGVERLQRAGIDVQVGLLEEDARQLNASYITYMTKQRPHVIWKAATTLDGKVATRTGASRWITGVAARELVHQVRSQTDAIMVGIGTVLQDDPELTARLQDGDATSLKQPMRIIVDSTLRIPLQARCLNPRLPGQAIVATTSAAPTDKLNALRNIGIKVWQGAPQRGKVDMVGLLRDLAAMQITSVLLEGGPTLAGSMLDARLIDECMIFIAPKLFGGEQAPHLLGGQGVALPKEAAEISHLKWRQIDTDLLVTGLLKWPQETGE